MNTPWGKADQVERVGSVADETILFVSTASHGGYYVPPHASELILPEYRKRAERWSGSPHWYEEDCEWASVAVTFPDLFTEAQLEAARQTIAWRERMAAENGARA